MADPAVKLTKAQAARLRRLSLGGEYHVASRPEVRALARTGLVETNEYGATCITAAGRALLDALKDEGKGRG